MTGPSFIQYFAEALPGGRAQMVCDIVVDGTLVMSFPSGTPAPAETFKRYERKVVLA